MHLSSLFILFWIINLSYLFDIIKQRGAYHFHWHLLWTLVWIFVSIERIYIDKRTNRGTSRYLTTCIEETWKSTRHALSVRSDFQLRLNLIQPSARFERVITLRSWNCVNDRARCPCQQMEEGRRWSNGRIGRPSRIDRQDLLIKLDFPLPDLLRPSIPVIKRCLL